MSATTGRALIYQGAGLDPCGAYKTPTAISANEVLSIPWVAHGHAVTMTLPPCGYFLQGAQDGQVYSEEEYQAVVPLGGTCALAPRKQTFTGFYYLPGHAPIGPVCARVHLSPNPLSRVTPSDCVTSL